MDSVLIYPRGSTDACACACTVLEQSGLSLVDHPCPEITHLLLDVPSLTPDGGLRGGGSLPRILEMLPTSVTVVGGNLQHPALSGHPVLDLLQDPEYVARNAAITAQCAIGIAESLLPVVLQDAAALVIGWGRIGKCLAKHLSALGCSVTVAARNPFDRAMIRALGWDAADISEIAGLMPKFRLLFNTVPAPILGAAVLDRYPKCIKLDLASIPGLAGCDVVYARGLPGQYAPESSGRLIANTVLRLMREETI